MTDDRGDLLTERRLPESSGLDRLTIEQSIAVMNAQDAIAVAAVAAVRKEVAQAVERVVTALRAGGRLIYFGAGTSGRLGVLDASECPPTFRSDPTQVQAVIAGGPTAIFQAVEGAEDSESDGAAAVDALNMGGRDVAMGIAAGGTTPFVHGVLSRAKARGCVTIFLCCVQPSENQPGADVVIRPLTGPEVVTGSTRLKAGTATKLVLNQITTIAMVQLGKVYDNLMVDVRASNAKLRERAVRMICTLTGTGRPEAQTLLHDADGHVKTAIVMHKRGLSCAKALEVLQQSGGSLRSALAQSPSCEQTGLN